jgi:hypothetical protein
MNWEHLGSSSIASIRKRAVRDGLGVVGEDFWHDQDECEVFLN